jgi:hypothetical protein
MAEDITRSIFNPVKHYSGVRQQQGRVSMDADWNEQVDIASHRVTIGALDTFGRTGVPRDNAGFRIFQLPPTGAVQDLGISPGRIYVDGILCVLESTPAPIVSFPSENQVQLEGLLVDGREFAKEQWVEVSAEDKAAPAPFQVRISGVAGDTQTLSLASSISGFIGKSRPQLRRITTYLTQPDSPSPAPIPTSGRALAYLDVWERTITALEDPEIRETALGSAGGADTTTRTRTISQVRLQAVEADTTCANAPAFDSSVFDASILPGTARLAARAEPTADVTAACILPPRAGFRRLENQLYRVEIHVGGTLSTGAPTFKWSRDNGSVVAAIVSPAPTRSEDILTINVSSLGRDQSLNFASGQVVELTDDGRELHGKPGILVSLTGASMGRQGPVLTADASGADGNDVSAFIDSFSTLKNPKVRRWDQFGADLPATVRGRDIQVREGIPIALESGVEVVFQPPPPTDTEPRRYKTGDYWLIPARTVTADVDWPRDRSGHPQFSPPCGILHHYCRLAMIDLPAPRPEGLGDCRQVFPPLSDAGIHINQVFLTGFTSITPNGGNLLNDGMVSLQDLAGGISIVCDTPIDLASLTPNSPSTLGKPTCFVTIYVPAVAPGAAAPFALQPMIVAATLALNPADSSTILWQPTNAAVDWMTDQLNKVLHEVPSPGPLLAHLTLRGNFLWARDNPSLYVDGESFGTPALPDATGNRRTDLSATSGDGRRGGDFETWFWLISPPTLVVSATSLVFDPLSIGTTSPPKVVSLTNSTSGTLTITIVATAGFAPTPAFPSGSNTLKASESGTIGVTFTPGQEGLVSGSMTVTATPAAGAGAPAVQGISLTGTGLGSGLIVSALVLNFGQVLAGATQPITRSETLTNSGTLAVTISAITIDDQEFSISGISIPATLPPGGDVNFDVDFLPVRTGNRSVRMNIAHDGAPEAIVISLIASVKPSKLA